MARIDRARTGLLLSAAFIIGMSSQAQAQTADAARDADSGAEAGPAKGEIIVTARKRAESLQDVAASIQAFQGPALQTGGFVDIQTLSATIPNFHYSNATGANDILVMRGLGTVGSGPHFEPAVGQVFNGFFASRSRLGRSAFMDVGQVEVLRGPQGAIIGKNTSLGAINVTPNKPTDTLEASLFTSYDFEDREGYEVEAVVSGPITEGVRARLAVNYKDRDGTIRNTAVGGFAQSVEDLSTRIIVEADVSDRVTAELLWQRSDFDRSGNARELSFCNNPAAVLAAIGDDCTLNGSHVNVNFFAGQQVGEPFSLEANMLGFTLNFDFDAFTVTSLTGYQEYTISDQFDSDLSPLDQRTINNVEDYEQFSQELRAVSNGRNPVDYIFGALFVTNTIDFVQDSDFRDAPANGGPLRRRQLASLDTDSISLFGELTWNATDTISLTGGARYTHEERDSTVKQTNFTIYTTDNEGARCGGGGFRICHEVEGSLSDDDISWNASARWKPIERTMFYASVATGFKSGAFNLLSGFNQALLEQTFAFGPEDSINYEFGGKHEFSNRRIRFNWTAFYTQINDLQISQNDPTVIAQIISNAGKARAKGVEIDSSFDLTDQFTVKLVGSYLDAQYTRFQNAPCFTGQTAAQGCVRNSANQLVQDLSGAPTTRAPEWTFTADAEYTIPLGGALELRPSGRWYFVDDHVLAVDNDPRSVQNSFHKFDASLTLAEAGDRWSVSLVARNLTNKFTRSFDDATTSINAFGGGGRFANTEESRTIALKARLRY